LPRATAWIGVAVFGAETIAPEAVPATRTAGQPDAGDLDVAVVEQPPAGCRRLALLVRHHRLGHMPPDAPMGFIGVQETSNMYGRANSSYRAPYGWGVYDTVSWNWRASWSYVTGGHSAKLGYTGTEMKYDWVNYTNPSLMRYTFNPPRGDRIMRGQSGTACADRVNYTITEDFENANRRWPIRSICKTSGRADG
jgi:hypothetical protein